MTHEFNRIKALGEIPKSHADRFRFLQGADRSVIFTVQRGIILIMAFWSGPSRQAFSQLKKDLAALDPDGHLELVVLDIDGCSFDLLEGPEFAGKIGGWGEVACVQDRRVICTSNPGYHPEEYGRLIRQLLECGETV